MAVEAAELLIDFFKTGAIRQSVNMPRAGPGAGISRRETTYIPFAAENGTFSRDVLKASPKRKQRGDVTHPSLALGLVCNPAACMSFWRSEESCLRPRMEARFFAALRMTLRVRMTLRLE